MHGHQPRKRFGQNFLADPHYVARIVDAYVGPYTAIGENVTVTGSEIEHSIVLEGSEIRDLHARMEASLLGKNVRLTRSDGMPKTLQFLVGDNAEIAIP